MTGIERGPHLLVGAFCDQVIEAKDGTLSLIPHHRRQEGKSPEFLGCGSARAGGAALRGVLRRAPGRGLEVEQGRFGARMVVELANDGPVTIVLDV